PAGTLGSTYTIKAVYSGTANFLTSTDTSHSLMVTAAASASAATNASATFSANSAQTISLSATVTSAAGTVSERTETCTILRGTTRYGKRVPVNVPAGAASTNYTLPAGTLGGSYTIQAVYNGTADYLTSTDTSHTLAVNAAATATAAANASASFSASNAQIA